MTEFLKNEKILTILLGLLGGGISGLATHFFAPWFKWKLDEKTQTKKMEADLKERRRELILTWRKMLISAEYEAQKEETSVQKIIQLDPNYLSLEPLLGPEEKKAVYRENRIIVLGSELQGASLVLKEEIARLEKEWGLV